MPAQKYMFRGRLEFENPGLALGSNPVAEPLRDKRKQVHGPVRTEKQADRMLKALL